MKGKWIRTGSGKVFEVLQDFIEAEGVLFVACAGENNVFRVISSHLITHVFDTKEDARGRIS